MTEILKEFFNGPVKLTDIAGGSKKDLYATTASQKAVLRDFELDFPGDAFALDLFVKGHNVGSFSNSATGQTIVDASSPIKLGSKAEYEDLSMAFGRGGASFRHIDLKNLGGQTIIDDSVDKSQSYTAPSMSTFVIADDYLTVGGWDGNGSQKLYKYDLTTGNVIFSRVNSSYRGQPVYGGDGWFYFCDGSSIRRLRVDDDSTGDAYFSALTGYGNSTYPLFGTNPEPAPNGDRLVISCNNGSGATVYVSLYSSNGSRVSANGCGTSNNGFWDVWGSQNSVIPFWSTSKNGWMVLFCGNGGLLRIGDIDPSGAISNTKESVVLRSDDARQVSVLGEKILVNSHQDGEIHEYDLSLNKVGVFYKSADLISQHNYCRPVFVKSTPTQAEIDGRDYSAAPSVNVRLTGVLVE